MYLSCCLYNMHSYGYGSGLWMCYHLVWTNTLYHQEYVSHVMVFAFSHDFIIIKNMLVDYCYLSWCILKGVWLPLSMVSGRSTQRCACVKCIHKKRVFLLKYALVLEWYFLELCIQLLYPRPTKLEGGYTGFTLSVCPSVRLSVRPSVCRRHGFRSISQVCFGISISNFICMLMVAIGRSLLIFSDVTFKMAAWRPYWIFWFPDSNFTLALNINFKLQQHNTYVYG